MHNSEPDVRRPIAPSLDESGGVRRSLKCLLVDTPVRPDPSAVSWVNPRLDPGEERTWRLRRAGRGQASATGLAHHAVAVAVPHERVRGMVARHRCDPVRSSLRATDAAVPVVVPRGDRLGNAGHGRGRDRNLATRERDQLRRGAPRKHLVQRVRLATVDGELVSLPNRDHPGREPSSGSAPAATRPRHGRPSRSGSRADPPASGSAGSVAKRRRVARSAAHRPLSSASKNEPPCARCPCRRCTVSGRAAPPSSRRRVPQ